MSTHQETNPSNLVKEHVAIAEKHGEPFASLVAFAIFFREVIFPMIICNGATAGGAAATPQEITEIAVALVADALSSEPEDDIEEALARMSAASAMDQIAGVGSANPMRHTLDS